MNIDTQGNLADISNPGQSIAFVSEASSQFRQLTRILRRVVGNVIESDSLTRIEGGELSLVAVSYDELGQDERHRLMTSFAEDRQNTTLVLLSAGSAQRDLASLFGSQIFTNLLVFNNPAVDVVDLLVTIQKILLRDIFGLEKYFTWGIRPFSIRLTHSGERRMALDTIDHYCQSIGIPKRLGASIQSAADEFITNALYNAPVDAQGRSRFSHFPRTKPIELEPGEEIEVRFCCDGRRFGIATRDPFGSLTPKRLHEYLARCFQRGGDQMDEDPGGAGLGFYHIFDALSHFVVNINPGICTEMIGLVDVSGSYKDFIKSGKSFNIFVGE